MDRRSRLRGDPNVSHYELQPQRRRPVQVQAREQEVQQLQNEIDRLSQSVSELVSQMDRRSSSQSFHGFQSSEINNNQHLSRQHSIERQSNMNQELYGSRSNENRQIIDNERQAMHSYHGTYPSHFQQDLVQIPIRRSQPDMNMNRQMQNQGTIRREINQLSQVVPIYEQGLPDVRGQQQLVNQTINVQRNTEVNRQRNIQMITEQINQAQRQMEDLERRLQREHVANLVPVSNRDDSILSLSDNSFYTAEFLSGLPQFTDRTSESVRHVQHVNAVPLRRHNSQPVASRFVPQTYQPVHYDLPVVQDRPSSQVPRINERHAEAVMNPQNNLQAQMMLQMSRMLARQSEADLWVFDGSKILDYPLFKKRFYNIFEEGGYSAAQGVAKLDKYIQGKARDLVDVALKTAANPGAIFAALDKVYGRTDAIKREIKSKIDKLSSVNDWHQFKEFSCIVKNVFIATDYLADVLHDTHNFMEKLVTKLAPHLASQFGSYCTEKSIPEGSENLKHLSDWVDSMSRITNMMLNANWEKTNPEEVKEKPEIIEKQAASVNTYSPTTKECAACKGTCKNLETCKVFQTLNYSKRRRIVDESRACFMCLGYHKNKCNKAKQCGINGCTRFHNKMLHKEQTVEEQNLNMNVQSCKAMLKFVPVTVKGPRCEKNVLAILDDGSTGTLIDESLANDLGLEGEVVPMLCRWVEDKFRYEKQSRTVNAEIKGIKKGMKYMILRNVRTMKDIGIPSQEINWSHIQSQFPYTSQADISMHDQKPKILIGQSNTHLSRVTTSIQPNVSQPCLSKTSLGWVIHGPTGNISSVSDTEQSYCIIEVTDDYLQEAVKNLFKLEEAMTKTKSNEYTKDENLALSNSSRTIHYNGERFEIGYPWKEEEENFPDSYGMALKRLILLEKKLKRDDELATRYKQEMQKLLDKNYSVQTSSSEIKEVARKWYLPHFYVRNPNKPGKVRVVFDAAAKVNGRSLNSFMFTGPDLYASLFGSLLKFRVNKIAWIADVEEMFSQVRITKQDSFTQLYLWRDLNDKIPPKIYRMQAMMFGITAAPFISQFVKNYNADGYSEEFPDAANEIKQSFYVDDWITGSENEHNALKLVEEVNHIMLAAGFYLRNYMSNSQELLQSLPEHLRAKENQGKIVKDEQCNRVLGILWNADKDELSYSINFHKVNEKVMNGEVAPTKRQVLSAAMSLFDPVGLIAPCTIKSRILLQNIWREGLHWDDQIKNKLYDDWLNWLAELSGIRNVKIQRLYAHNFETVDDLEMHVFCDAGDDAYACVVYFRINQNSHIETSLVAAKAKVTPLKQLTTPRLELQAALMGSRLACTVNKEINCKLSKRYFWTDSKTVLLWLRTDKQLKSYVASRTAEILERSKVSEWKWVPTKLNPADLCTRNKKKINLVENEFWFKGPAFLLKEKHEWPDETQLRIQETEDIHLIIESVKIIDENNIDIPLPEIKWHYDWYKLLKVTAYVKHIVENFKSKNWKNRSLSKDDIIWSEKLWIKKVQRDCFSQDIENIKKNNKNKTGRLATAPLVIDDDGILRVRNRLHYSNLTPTATDLQIVLDGDHPYVKLLLMYYHLKFKHHFFEATVNDILRSYKIPHLRSKLSKVVSKCKYCRKMKVKSPIPIMGPMPELRLQVYKKPFSTCGLDYFGPILVKQGRSHVKRYGALFCCMTTRAVHVEVAADLSKDSCINALRRMMSRRGKIEVLYSDNGTNFKGSNRELIEALQSIDYGKFEEFLTEQKIQWKFNPPSSPHFGGAWERLVGLIKLPLKAILQDRIVTEDVLTTTLAECEYLVNSRPLTFVSTKDDEPVAISPNDLLIRENIQIGVPGMFTDYELKFGKQWKAAQVLADQFWRRFVNEYLNQLKVPKKWISHCINLKSNDVVYVSSEQIPRLSWPLGVVTTVSKGRDGNVRVVNVKMASGKLVTRKVQDLYPLGMTADDVALDDYVDEALKENQDQHGGHNVAT